MRHRDLLIRLDGDLGVTLTQRVARTIEKAIRGGQLKPAAALPGTRDLSKRLGVSLNTIKAAIRELELEGWIISEPKRGTFVSARPPIDATSGASHPVTEIDSPIPGFDLPSRLSPVTDTISGAISLVDGIPDPSLAPSEALAKAYQRALRLHGKKLLEYGEPMGNQLLRESLAAWVSERHGVTVSPGQLLITRGSRMALILVGLALFRSGDGVVVEDPGNRGAWDTLRQCSDVTLHPVPVNLEGIQLDLLAPQLEHLPIRALYLTPRRQFPTTASMGADRGRALLKLAAQHRVAVLEDDLDGAYHYGAPRPISLLSLDTTGQVIHIGSLSRLLAPGIRLGFIIAPERLVERLARVRRSMEWQGDRTLEWAVADLFRDGEMTRHLRRAHKVYEARRDFLVDRLNRELGDHLQATAPGGGLSLWVRIGAEVPAETWIHAARQQGLILNPPRHFFMGDPDPFVRIGFSQVEESVLEEAVKRLKRALGKLGKHAIHLLAE